MRGVSFSLSFTCIGEWESLDTTFICFFGLLLLEEDSPANVNGFISKSVNWVWKCLMTFPGFVCGKSFCLTKDFNDFSP